MEAGQRHLGPVVVVGDPTGEDKVRKAKEGEQFGGGAGVTSAAQTVGVLVVAGPDGRQVVAQLKVVLDVGGVMRVRKRVIIFSIFTTVNHHWIRLNEERHQRADGDEAPQQVGVLAIIGGVDLVQPSLSLEVDADAIKAGAVPGDADAAAKVTASAQAEHHAKAALGPQPVNGAWKVLS